MLTKMVSERLGYSIPMTTQNACAPLACEWAGAPGAPQSRELAGGMGLFATTVDSPFIGLGGTQSSPNAANSRFASDAAARAAEIARCGVACGPEDAARISAQALAVSPDVGEAYNIKAMRCAASLEEALELFRAGRAAAERALKPEFSPAALAAAAAANGSGKKGQQRSAPAWEMLEVRPLIRAQYGAAALDSLPLRPLASFALHARALPPSSPQSLQALPPGSSTHQCGPLPSLPTPGVANTLRKLGRWAEAAAEYAALDRIDPACHCTSGAWVNWKAHYPDTLIAAGDAAGARAYMAWRDNAEAHEVGSSQLVRAAAGAPRVVGEES